MSTVTITCKNAELTDDPTVYFVRLPSGYMIVLPKSALEGVEVIEWKIAEDRRNDDKASV